MKKILLTLITIGTLSLADFSRSGDIVTDNATKLQWQDDATAASTNLIWSAAIDYCEALTLGGHNDWRLPNIRELKSITDKSKTNPAIKSAFIHTLSSFYWSSTTHSAGYGNYGNNAWVVHFNAGDDIYDYNKNDLGNVRCVR